MAENIQFGALLRGLRTAAGLTLEQLAEASGVSDRSISDMERGVNPRPRARTVNALADALGTTGPRREELLATARAGRIAATTTPANRLPMPGPPDDFTGRGDELARVNGWATGTGAVVVISGDAGVGKTTFAIRAAQDWPADEQLFVDLRGLDAKPLTAAATLARLIRALDPAIRSVPREVEEASALWQTLLAGRRLVVVLDNAVDESQVRPVLPASGPAVALVTSRRVLGGLEDVHRLQLGRLPEADSVALLAGILGPTDATPEQLRRIAELCVHIPLALRIAATRLLSRPDWTAEDLITRLAAHERRLDALATGDLQVRAAFDLSYQQLSGVPRRLFRRLALVPGASTGAELASVLVEEPVPDTEDALDDLVDLSLLQQRPDGRLAFHDLLRLYADGELDREENPADRASAARRRDDWLLNTATVAGRHFEPDFGPGRAGVTEVVEFTSMDQAADWIRAEADNWLPALHAAATTADDRVTEVADSLHWFSDSWISWPGWETVFSLSSAAAERLGDDRLRAIHEGYLSWVLLIDPDRSAEALEQARRALDSAGRSGDRRQIGWAHYYVGWAHKELRQSAESVQHCQAATAEFRRENDREGLFNALLVWARALDQMGSPAEAARIYREVVAAVRDPATAPPPHIAEAIEATAYTMMGEAEDAAGRLPEALEAFSRQLEIRRRQSGNDGPLVGALARRAAVHLQLGNLAEARSDVAEIKAMRGPVADNVRQLGPISETIERVDNATDDHQARKPSR